MYRYFTKEEFQYIKDIYEKTILSDEFKQRCVTCPDVGSVCKERFCSNIKRIMNIILDNWRE